MQARQLIFTYVLSVTKKKLFVTVRLIPGHIANDVTEGDAQREDGRPRENVLKLFLCNIQMGTNKLPFFSEKLRKTSLMTLATETMK